MLPPVGPNPVSGKPCRMQSHNLDRSSAGVTAKKEALHPENGKAGLKAVTMEKEKDRASRKCCRSMVKMQCMVGFLLLIRRGPDSL